MANNNQPVPLDYLDQIAPVENTNKKIGFNLKTIFAILLATILLAVILMVATNSITSEREERWQHLYSRLESLSEIVEDSSSKLKDGQLRNANSNLKLYTASTTSDLTTQMEAKGISSKKISDSITAAESNEAILEELEDGRLNAKYDSTYAREVSYILETTLSLLKKISTSDNSSSGREFAQSAYDNLEPIYTIISEYDAESE